MLDRWEKATILKVCGYAFAAFTGFMTADLLIVNYRYLALPTQAPPVKPHRPTKIRSAPKSDFSVIVTRNLFNSDGVIPDPWGSEKGDEGAPILSSLPLELLGTIVHANPKKSVATVRLKNRNEINPYMINEEIEGLATVIRIERRRMIMRNLSTQRLEYIEIPEESKLSLGLRKAPAKGEGEAIAQTADGEITVPRKMLDEKLRNLNELLQQAKAVPNYVPGAEGQVDGFRVLQIDPDSVFEKLGIRPMDVLKSVNGDHLNSAAKAMELYQALKSSNSIEMTIERNGREQTLRYRITE